MRLSSCDYKTCGKCSETKLSSEFYGHRGAKTQAWCKSCQRDYYRNKVKANPRYFLDYQQQARATKRARVSALKTERGCVDCGMSHPACLEWHHLDPSAKEHNVVRLVDSNAGWARIEAEIAKCIVLCANCHKIRHHNERTAQRTARSA